MARTILGQKLSFTVDAAGTVTGTAPASGKIDIHPMFVKTHAESGEPVSFDFVVPHYHLSTHNKLIGVTVVVVPVGHGEPATVDDWMNSSYPKATVDTSAVGAQAAGTPTAATPVAATPAAATPVAPAMIAGIPIAAPVAIPVAAVAAPVATAPVAPVAVAPVAPVATVATTATTSSGTPISIPVPNVPVGDQSAQVLLTYDS